MTTAQTGEALNAREQVDDPHHARRWLVLAVVSIAQLMVVLDITIVNIALPRAQEALKFANSDRQWIVTSYTLTFGSLLLLGGRLGDLFGRKWAFVGGLAGFALASAIGGAAPNFAVLVSARALQGVFAALLAPAALSTLANTFRDPNERGKAFAVFGAVAGGGSAVGLLLGGLLTEYLSWRYCLYVNLVFAISCIPAALVLLHNEKQSDRPPLDIPGTVLASAGLFGIVFGFSRAETSSWTSPVTIVSLAAGVSLLVAFVVTEQRVKHPLLPMRVVVDRTRGGSFVAIAISAIAIFAVFLFLTFYLQNLRGYSPVKAGLVFLPFTAGIICSSTAANVFLLSKVGPRWLVASGMIAGGITMLGFLQLGAHSSYVTHVLPELIVLGLGFGLIVAPTFNTATAGVQATDAGIASALVNTMQQVGGSIGTALLSTIAANATSDYAAARAGRSVTTLATLHGYHVAFAVSAGFFVLGALVCGSLLPAKPASEGAAVGELVMAH